MRSNHYSLIDTILQVDTNNVEDLKGNDGRYHYFYKIVNNKTNCYYYGVHSTYDLDDYYSGSGMLLRTVYKKYGIENFTNYILEFFDDRKSLLNYEKQIVTQELVKSKECYNLTTGGVGISDYNHPQHYTQHTTRGLIHINNGIKTKLVKQQEIENYLQSGWVIGQLQKSTQGKIVIHKEGFRDMYIFPEELEKYSVDGWCRGGRSRNKGQTSHAKDKHWINNGEVCKRVTEDVLQSYLDQGWKPGAIQRFIKGYIRITNGKEDKIIAPENKELLQYYLDQGWRRGSHTKHNDKCWISKGNESKRIPKEDLQQYIDQGWKRGNVNLNRIQTITNAGKIAMTSPDKHIKYVNPEDLQKYLDQGYKKGNIFNKRPSASKGDIRMNNGEVSKSIKPEDLQKYLDLGWKRGNIHKIVTKGRYRITNGKEERFVTPEEFETLDHSIWQRGLTRSRKSKINQ